MVETGSLHVRGVSPRSGAASLRAREDVGGVDAPGGLLRSHSGRLVLPALFLVAVSLRPQIVGVGPLIPAIRADLDVSYWWAGLLTTIPVLCMGLFARLAPPVARRVGTARGVAVAAVAIAVTGVVRAAAPTPTGILAATVAVGVAVAVTGTLLPVVVKQAFSDRPLTATGVYVAGIQTGAATSALVAVPLAGRVGGWRGSLVVISVVALVVAIPWTAVAQGPSDRPGLPVVVGSPGRPRAVTLLAALFALQSIPFFGLITWLPTHLVESGWTEARAGAALALLNVMGLATSLTVPRVGDRVGSRRLYLWGGAGLAALAVTGLMLLPAGGYVWAVVAGVGLSVLFTVTLTLPLDAATDTTSAASLSATVLGVGYTVAAGVPALLGAVRDWTGGFQVPLGLLLVSLVVFAGLAAGAPQPARTHPPPRPS